jgi:ectoine hydroxylase-related dioxygenase (phytanoyl-CoA dioxygenase family)
MIETIHGELVPSTDLIGDPRQLRDRMADDGYLFLPGLLNSSAVATTRADILDICREAGWLAGGNVSAAVVPSAACEPPDPRYYEVYRRVVSLESYNSLPHDPALFAVARALLDEVEVLLRPARLARLVFPQPGLGATPPHQDFPHEQGTYDAYTAWLPLGRVDRPLGGLAVWPGSHRNGVVEHGFVYGTGGLGIHTGQMAPRWLSADFQAGDVVLFHSLTVHGALPNRTADGLRISADVRFQRACDPVAPHMLQPSGGQLTWEDVYAAWKSDDLKYYWRRWELTSSPFDYRYYHKRDDEVMALAREGDTLARRFLTTISLRSPDAATREAARHVLSGDPEGG